MKVRTIQPEPVRPSVCITLDHDEAVQLARVMRAIGGFGPIRMITSELDEALEVYAPRAYAEAVEPSSYPGKITREMEVSDGF